MIERNIGEEPPAKEIDLQEASVEAEYINRFFREDNYLALDPKLYPNTPPTVVIYKRFLVVANVLSMGKAVRRNTPNERLQDLCDRENVFLTNYQIQTAINDLEDLNRPNEVVPYPKSGNSRLELPPDEKAHLEMYIQAGLPDEINTTNLPSLKNAHPNTLAILKAQALSNTADLLDGLHTKTKTLESIALGKADKDEAEENLAPYLRSIREVADHFRRASLVKAAEILPPDKS